MLERFFKGRLPACVNVSVVLSGIGKLERHYLGVYFLKQGWSRWTDDGWWHHCRLSLLSVHWIVCGHDMSLTGMFILLKLLAAYFIGPVYQVAADGQYAVEPPSLLSMVALS